MNKNIKITLEMFKKAVKNGMRVLHLDIETSLGTFCGFQIGSRVNISYKQILTAPQVMCVQYKWEGDKKANYLEWDKVRERTVYDSGFDNSKLLKEISKLIQQSDIICGQNNDNFDMKMLQDGLVNNNLPAFDYEVTLDILKMSRKVFRPLSHKLDSRAKKYGYEGKIEMDLEDWKDVTFNDKPISAKMGPYGCKDVIEEQKIFYREFEHYKLPKKVISTILKFLPEFNLDKDLYINGACLCGSPLIKNGTRVTRQGRKQCYLCSRCGKITQEK